MRYYTDCRETPSVQNCTVGIIADSKKEVVEAATQHAVDVHGHSDPNEIRGEIEKNVHTTERDILA